MFSQIIKKLKERFCRVLCKDQLFNSDMSLEIDRLTLENEELRENVNDR